MVNAWVNESITECSQVVAASSGSAIFSILMWSGRIRCCVESAAGAGACSRISFEMISIMAAAWGSPWDSVTAEASKAGDEFASEVAGADDEAADGVFDVVEVFGFGGEVGNGISEDAVTCGIAASSEVIESSSGGSIGWSKEGCGWPIWFASGIEASSSRGEPSDGFLGGTLLELFGLFNVPFGTFDLLGSSFGFCLLTRGSFLASICFFCLLYSA